MYVYLNLGIHLNKYIILIYCQRNAYRRPRLPTQILIVLIIYVLFLFYFFINCNLLYSSVFLHRFYDDYIILNIYCILSVLTYLSS